MSLPLDVALRQCERHAAVMREAQSQIPSPPTSAALQRASPELIRIIDQFVLRFTKLQDTMGAHVLRQFAVQLLAEPVEDSAFIDVLNVLEQRGYVTTEAWALQRSTRNALTHEYHEDPERQALALSAALLAADQLVAWLRALRQRAR
jgi:hypothetical protein